MFQAMIWKGIEETEPAPFPWEACTALRVRARTCAPQKAFHSSSANWRYELGTSLYPRSARGVSKKCPISQVLQRKEMLKNQIISHSADCNTVPATLICHHSTEWMPSAMGVCLSLRVPRSWARGHILQTSWTSLLVKLPSFCHCLLGNR